MIKLFDSLKDQSPSDSAKDSSLTIKEIEREIERARRDHDDAFTLSSLNLTHVPESIGRLSRLWHLSLHSNHLTTLPKSIGLLHRLQTLDLSNNSLAELPEPIGELTQLQTLDLS